MFRNHCWIPTILDYFFIKVSLEMNHLNDELREGDTLKVSEKYGWNAKSLGYQLCGAHCGGHKENNSIITNRVFDTSASALSYRAIEKLDRGMLSRLLTCPHFISTTDLNASIF